MSAFRPPAIEGSQAPPTSSFSDVLSPRSSLNSTPANDSTYASLCKVVLARRMRNMLALTAFATLASLLVACFDPREVSRSLLNFVPSLLFAPVAFLGTLPLFVLRKRTITTPRPPPPTRFAQLSQLRNRSTVPVFLTYLSGVAAFHFAYVWCASSVSTEARLGLFFYHQGRDSWQVNERRITLAVVHAVLAGVATVRHVLLDRSQVHFEKDTSLLIPARLAAQAVPRLRSAVRSTGITVLSFWTVYVLVRRPVLRFVLVHVAGAWARPHLYTMMRHSGAYSLTLAARALSSSFLCFAVWEAAHACFEVYATQPMTVSQFGSNPNQALLSGLRSADPYYQSFAYLELAVLTLTSPKRREAIFRDVKPGTSVGGAWTEISRECLLLVGKELQRSRGRGNLATSPNATASRSSGSAGAQDSPNRAQVKAGDVFVPTKPSFFDKLASTSSASPATPSPLTQKATTAVSSAVSTARSELSSRVPSILQTGPLSENSSPASNGIVPTSKPLAVEDVPTVLGMEDKVAKWVPIGWRRNAFGIEPEYRIGRCAPRVLETVCAVQALSNLTCASLHEDPYGVAQRDIPKVLEAFVRYLSVLEAVEREFESVATDKEQVMGKDVAERWRAVSDETVGQVQRALRQGAKAILTEFAPYLSEFRFPTSIAAELQVLVDWGG
ncbi:hypothetical protein JCM10212_001476 [Sporobolomyces blumeae]